MCNFFPIVIKLQNLNEVLLKGFQLGCKINDLCTNLHPSLVGVLTEIGRQECNWLKFFVPAPNVTTKSNWLQSSGGGLAPHNAYTTMDASSFPPLQSFYLSIWRITVNDVSQSAEFFSHWCDLDLWRIIWPWK